MPELVECQQCGRGVSSQAARRVAGKVVCPGCVALVKAAAKAEKAMAKRQKETEKTRRALQKAEERERLAEEREAERQRRWRAAAINASRPEPARATDDEQDGVVTGLGIASACLMGVGVFCPFISAPIFGTVSYVHGGKGDGMIVLAFAGLALLLTFTKRRLWLFLPGTLCMGLLLYSYLTVSSKLEEIKTNMAQELAGNPFAGIGKAFVDSVQLQWGWAVVALGGLLALIAGLRAAHLRATNSGKG